MIINKKICIISPSLKMGGIERALTVLADFFNSEGHLISFISAQGGDKFYSLNKGVNFYEPNLERKKGIISKITTYYTVVKFINNTVKEINPDVVLSFGDAFNPLVLFALRNVDIPIYISDRTSPDFNFSKIINFGKKIFYPKSAGFIAQTKRAADYKIKQFDDKLNIKIIPNAIKKNKKFNIKKKNIILSVGRLSYEKGHDRLIKSFSKLKNNSNWKLVIAGSGPMMDELKKLTVSLKINDKVKFLGIVKNVDLLLSEASIFVLPSRLEGFPNALCEAMSAGLPCVCFDSIPTEALLEDNYNGIIIAEGNIDQLSHTLTRLMNNRKERNRLGENAMKIQNRLSVEKIGKEFLSFMLNN